MKRSIPNQTLLYVVLVIAAVIVLFPLYQAVVTSLASEADVSNYPPKILPTNFRLENFGEAMNTAPILRYLLNSIIQASIVTISHLILASLAAYAFAFIEFRFKQFFFLLFLSTMMIPWEATIIPNYLTIVNELRLKDNFIGLTLPYLATAFGTFMLRQFFMSIPRDLYDAAVIDGCGRIRFLITIAMPLARPALGTLAVFSFLQTYNQYLWPLLVTNDKNMRTVQIGLALLQDQERFLWNIVMAGVVMILLPTFILFIVGNRQLIRGLTAGAVKG
ncbi:MAG: carbohydrate ABC transporter permease [Chloroflexi bacterium]|nr:carbohydrate ABC transporter permease [Chloroflexota bacterium]MBI5348248.1 carbohydrate ABC transporter permease [Chloroflexota bacterium]MBI5714815.1 carbohydrate ABC transporter permease [Chloroflexota bacterium]